MILPESATSNYISLMTHACEKIFKKLPRNQQEDIKAKISEVCANPYSVGHKLLDASMVGFRHDHAGNIKNNVLVVWSIEEEKKTVWIESVGSHKNMENLQSQRTRMGYGI
jgi:mRNA-degrading endonuclease RelE of RelBE toxin-antitoxin system